MDKKERVTEPVPFDLLEKEIPGIFHYCSSNGLELYFFRADQAPFLMKEVGRLRELSFRSAGGGTGDTIDIDEWDRSIFYQIVCIDHENREVTGGYRLVKCSGIDMKPDRYFSAVDELFLMSEPFKENVFRDAVELGRSFVNAEAKRSRDSLDALWAVLCKLAYRTETFRYYLGKVTYYPQELQPKALDLLLYFLDRQFPGDDGAAPRKEVAYLPSTDEAGLQAIGDVAFDWSKGYEENRKILFLKYTRMKQSLRPFMLLFKYIDMTDEAGIKIYGGALNAHCGNVIEVMLLLDSEHGKAAMVDHYVSGCAFREQDLF